MKKLEKRALLCVLLSIVLMVGMGYFVFTFVTEGNEWAAFYTNRAVNSNGHLARGTLKDVNGTTLLKNRHGNMIFSDDYETRCALVHLTGDDKNNIATGANNVMADKLVGYNILNGTYTFGGGGRIVRLTVDAEVCKAAYEALYGHSGTVGVYNYRTGEIICAVSTPAYDPADPPDLSSDDTSGTYINRLFAWTTPPGSTFKVATTAAALENKSDARSWHYDCSGVQEYGPDKVTDLEAHGSVNLKEALAVSCNCGFGELTLDLGADVMEDAVEKYGLTKVYDIDGIKTKAGTFEFPENADVNLAWAGVGQHNDMINPASMMVFMGGIANGGEAVSPKIVKSVEFANGSSADLLSAPGSEQIMESETALRLRKHMRNNVRKTYGDWMFPGLKVYAKSGTAEVDKTKEPNALFAGFVRGNDMPYAFIVVVENGGYGTETAGTVANTVLQKIKEVKGN